MLHRSKGRKLGRTKDQRRLLLKSLANSFLKHEKMETTEAKAKEIRPIVEKLITKARKNTLANQRLLLKTLTKENTKKMMKEIGPRYVGRNGGYTRITKLGPRAKDKAEMAKIELV
ncbi:MAG: 50S ribosomal protein L17 [Patescibacteria group bacterium]